MNVEVCQNCKLQSHTTCPVCGQHFEKSVSITSEELETIAEGVDTVSIGPYGRAWDVIDKLRARFKANDGGDR